MTRAIHPRDRFASVAAEPPETAVAFGDEGSDTFGHIARACAEGRADVEGLRKGRLKLPTLESLGLVLAGEASTREAFASGLRCAAANRSMALWGFAREISRGQGHAFRPLGDSPAHQRISHWGYFPD